MKTRPHDEPREHIDIGTRVSPISRSPWAQFELLVANLRDGVTVQDANGRIVYANEAGANLSGYATAEELLAAPPADFLKKFEILDPTGAPVRLHDLPGRRALLLGAPADALIRVRARTTGHERWSDVRSFVVSHPSEDATFVVNVFRDVSAGVLQQRLLEDQAEDLEEQTAQAHALAEALEEANDHLSDALQTVEEDRRRQVYLSKATALLGTSLDYTTTLGLVASLVVPELADWCSITLYDQTTGAIQELSVAHADPRRVEWARNFQKQFPLNLEAPRGVGHVLRTGQPELYSTISDRMLVDAARNGDELTKLREIGLWSAMIAPLRAGARTFGAITFVAAESGKHYNELDLGFATELGLRAGIAIERAKSHQEVVVAREAAVQRLAWLTRLQQLTVALSRALLPHDVVRIALDEGGVAFGADRASVWQIDHRASSILLLGQRGYADEVVHRFASIPLDAPIMQADCARTGEPILCGDQPSMEARYPMIVQTIREVKAHAVALFPIRVGGSVIGVLSYSYGAPREFTDDFAIAGRTFAKELGQALDRTHAHAALDVARQAADAASQAKSAFLATMSHELRTPINAILGFTDLLRLGLASGESVSESEYLARIRRNTEHLLELVNDVLDWAKVEAGQLVVESRLADSKSVMDDTLSVMREQAAARGLSLTSSCDMGASYVGDALRVRQILLNLVSNAVKFTMPGGRVRLTCTEHDGVTEFVVADTGIGVAPDELVRIFEPFVQAEGGYTRPHGGTGLGLSISRRLARMMSGDVTAESEVGKGSRFVLTLPSGVSSEDASWSVTSRPATFGAGPDV